MSEAESHVLKQRLLAGKRAKAARGELGRAVPMGYVRRPSGEVIKDPLGVIESTGEMMSKHIGIVACSAEGAALCYQTLCAEAPALMGEHITLRYPCIRILWESIWFISGRATGRRLPG